MHRLVVIALVTMILVVGCYKKTPFPDRKIAAASLSATGFKAFSGDAISFLAEPQRCEALFSRGYATIHIAAPAGTTGTAQVQCGGVTLPGASCTVTAPGTCTATGDVTQGQGIFGCTFTPVSGATVIGACHFDL